MAALFLILALLLLIFGCLCLAEDEIKSTRTGIACLVLALFLVVFPFYRGAEPLKIEHQSLKSNRWEKLQFDSVMTIDYDLIYYPWWTYKAVSNNGTKINVKIRQ